MGKHNGILEELKEPINKNDNTKYYTTVGFYHKLNTVLLITILVLQILFKIF